MSQISLTLPDGNSRDYAAGITAAEVAADISTSLAKKAISATVNGEHYDLAWPIEANADIAIHTLKDEDQANELIRHDFAHVMARAVQELWPDVKVTIGPVIENGWYYDFDREESFTPEDSRRNRKKMKEIINLRDTVRTEIWPRDKACTLQRQRRALQSRADRRHPGRRAAAHVLAWRVARPLPRPALAAHRPAPCRRLQADERCGRLLAR